MKPAILRWIQANPGRNVLVVCGHTDRIEGSAEQPVVRLANCLAERPVADLAELAVCGAKTVRFDPATCSLVDVEPLLQMLPGIFALGESGAGIPGYVLDEAKPPVPRRMLWLGRGEAELPVSTGTDQERLVAALARLGIDPAGDSKAELLTVQGCIACGVCVRSCRQNALSLQHDGDVSRLVFTATLCTGARGCVMFCPAKAMRSTRSMTLAELAASPTKVLAETSTLVCKTCKARFPAADESSECRVCRISPLHGG